MLEIIGLNVSVEDRDILRGVDLRIKTEETHVLFGPNGGVKVLCYPPLWGSRNTGLPGGK